MKIIEGGYSIDIYPFVAEDEHPSPHEFRITVAKWTDADMPIHTGGMNLTTDMARQMAAAYERAAAIRDAILATAGTKE